MTAQAKAGGRFDVRRMSWKRLVGLAAVTGIAVGALYYIGDNTLVLKADGLVLRDRQAAAAPYEARVKQIFVHSGDYVHAGQRLATLESLSMGRNLAELAAQKARLTSTIAHLEARRAVVEAMLPIARSNASRAQTMVAQLEQARERGLASFVHLQQVTAEAYTASERLATLQAEGTSSEEEVRQNQVALAEMNMAYQNLKTMYADGELLAPASGYVGTSIVDSGEVLLPGKKVVEIYSGQPYVLAYLAESSFVNVTEGEDVRVSSAGKSTNATVERILPLAEALPPEFQKPIQARDRGQLLRIALRDAQNFVTEQKVRVTGCYLAGCDDVAGAARKVGQRVTDRIRERYDAALSLVGQQVEAVESIWTTAGDEARLVADRIREGYAAALGLVGRQAEAVASIWTTAGDKARLLADRIREGYTAALGFAGKQGEALESIWITAGDNNARPVTDRIREKYATVLRLIGRQVETITEGYRAGQPIETVEAVAGRISACVREVPAGLPGTELSNRTLRIPLTDVQAFLMEKSAGASGCYIAACDDTGCTIAGCNGSANPLATRAGRRPAPAGIREEYATALRRVRQRIETVEAFAGRISACVREAYPSLHRVERRASTEPATRPVDHLAEKEIEPQNVSTP